MSEIEPPKDVPVVHEQPSAYASPWSRSERVRMVLWEFCWALFCMWTPKPLYLWRLAWLKLFGACIDGHPFVHQKARIQKPWNLTMHDKAALGDGAIVYSLGPIEIKARATVAQEVYLCTGTHDFASPNLELITAKITIEEDAFIGARAFVMPGVTIGRSAVIGAASVVTRDVPAWTIYAGNPAKKIKDRPHL